MKCEIRSKYFDEHVEEIENDIDTFEEDMEQLVYDDECGYNDYDYDYDYDYDFYSDDYSWL